MQLEFDIPLLTAPIAAGGKLADEYLARDE